jgi:F0F1-type ATP synthase membrane subunit b/b'
MKNLEKTLENALENIEEDRAVTKELLQDLMKYLAVAEDRHREVGSTAAKYVETLQRSNEQLVKIAALLQKNKSTSFELTADDKDNLYDLINQPDPEE